VSIISCQCYDDNEGYCPLHSQSTTDARLKEKIRELIKLPWGDGPYWKNAIRKLCQEILKELDGDK